MYQATKTVSEGPPQALAENGEVELDQIDPGNVMHGRDGWSGISHGIFGQTGFG